MEIKPFILAFLATVLLTTISSTTFANDNVAIEIKTNQDQPAEAETRDQMYLFWNFVTCPDGTVMASGVFGFTVNGNNQVTSVYHDNWGETVACADHQLVHWA